MTLPPPPAPPPHAAVPPLPPVLGPPAVPAYRPVPPRGATGVLAYQLGLLVLVPLPILSNLLAGAAMALAYPAQRTQSPIAAANARRAANWGLTLALATLTVVGGAIALAVATTPPDTVVRTGASPAPLWVLALLLPLGVAHVVVVGLGWLRAARGEVAHPPALPFLRPSREESEHEGRLVPAERAARARWRNRLVAGVTAGVVAVGGGLAVAGVVGAGTGRAPAVDLGEAEFAEVHHGVPRDAVFDLPLGYDLPHEAVDDAVQVYLDPLLTVRAPDADVRLGGDLRSGDLTVVVRPSVVPLSGFLPGDDPSDPFALGDPVDLTQGGVWGFSERYFIAELVDLGTGEQLTEPRVTAFTIAGVPATSHVAVTVDNDGVGHLSWAPVGGATQYLVVSVRADEGELGAAFPEVIGSTTESRWTTVEQDAGVAEGLADDDPHGFGVISQNRAFAISHYTDDVLQDLEVIEDEDERTPKTFGVIALTGDGPTPLMRVAEPDLSSALPYQVAVSALGELVDGRMLDSAAQLPAHIPVSMADGTTVLRTALYDVERITPPSPEDETSSGAGWYRVEARVEGTLFRTSFSLWDESAAAVRTAVQARVDEIQAERGRTGAQEQFVYAGSPPSLEDVVVSSTTPEVAYPVNGSNPLTLHLGANLVAGNEHVYVGDHLVPGTTSTSTGVELWDALGEALAQNPYALGRVEVGYLPAEQVLTFTYLDHADLDARAAQQEQLADAVQAVVAEVVTEQMGEEEKVRALNEYLVRSAEYDFAALAAIDAGDPGDVPDAFTAYGVLVARTGVCASYASAFLALAEAAGLEAVYVTGETAPGLHAWNKVLVDGAWRVVDVTWNDSSPADKYLLLSDAEASETRAEDVDWILDSRVGDYATG